MKVPKEPPWWINLVEASLRLLLAIIGLLR